MNFADTMRSDLDAIYTANEFDEEISVNGVAVRAIVGTPDATTEQYPAVRGLALTATVRVSEVALVSRGDAAIVRGVTYKVVGEPINDLLEWSFELALNKVSL